MGCGYNAIISTEHQYQQTIIMNIEPPPEILEFCDKFTYDAERESLRHLDCVYMHMGLYGNDPKQLEEMRQRIFPVF